MGSGFLRDVALRKQLEEKVKEASKARQAAEEVFAAAKGLIEGAKGIQGNVAEAESALAAASAFIAGKDYRAALEKATEAREKGRRAYAERARHFLDSTRSLLKVSKGMGVEDQEGQYALDLAEEALGKEGFADAIDLAKRAWKKSEKVIHEHLSFSFSTAQSLILTAKNIGKDTVAAEDLLSRARSAVEANDFEVALSFTKECLDAVTAELRGEVDRAMADAQAALNTVKEFGGDATNIERLMERAKADLGRGEYEKALNAVRQVRQEAEKSLGKGLESRTSEFARLLTEAEAIGADVTEARTLFRAFDRAMKEGRLGDATGIARDGYLSLQKTQFDRVLVSMSASRDKFIAAKNIGADLSPAIEHLNRARAALQAGQFQTALAESKKADQAVEQIVREHQSVDGEMRSMQAAMADAEVLGVNVGPAKRYLERARAVLGQRDFRGAVDHVRRSRDELERAQSERSMEIIEKAESLLSAGEKMGADLDESSRTLEEAAVAAKGKNFPKAMEYATRSRELTERAVQRTLNESIVGLNSSMQFLGEDAASVRTLLDRAESALSARDFETAYGYLAEALRLAEGKTKEKAMQFRELLRGAIQTGIELGADVGPLEAGLKETNLNVDRGKYVDVIVLKDRLAREIGLATDNIFNLVKAKVVEAKNLQVDITEMRELLKQAKMAVGVEDHVEALNLLRECNARANRTIGIHKEVYNAISSAAALVAEAKKRDVNVNKVLEMLLEAKRAHERFDHEGALDLAQKAKAETEKLMVLYTSAQKIIAAREMLDLVSKSGIDAPHLREMLDEAKEAMKNKEYDKALAYSERGDKAVRDLIQERVQGMLGGAETLIRSLEGLNLLSQEEKVILAREALDRGSLAEALEIAQGIREEVESVQKNAEAGSVAISRAKDLEVELEVMNVRAPGASRLLADAEVAQREGRFDDAIAWGTRAGEEFERSRQEGVEGMISRFEVSVAKAKQEMVDTRSAEKLLLRAREFLKERKYRQALALAMQAEGEAEKVGLQQDMAAKAIATNARKLGAFGFPFPNLEKMLEEAKRVFNEGDYIRALDVAIKTGEEFNHVRELYEEAVEVGKRAQRLYDVGFSIGLDVERVAADLKAAEAILRQGQPDRARNSYQVALGAAQGLVRAELDALMRSGGDLVEVAKRMGVDPSVTQRKLVEAKAQFAAEDYEGAARFTKEAKAIAKGELSKIVEAQLVAVQSNTEHSRKLGADTMKAGEMLGKARFHLQAGEYEAAIEAAKNSEDLIHMRLDSEKEFADRTFQAESVIRRAKKFGLDVLTAERTLAEALHAKKTDPDRGMSLAQQALEMAQKAIEEVSPNVTATLEVYEPVVGEWADGTLTLLNTAKALAKDVGVKILGDAEVEGLKEVPALKARGTETLPIRVRMTAAGSVPLAIQIKSLRLLDGKEYNQEVIATVLVGESAPVPASEKKLQAGAESRCPMCKGLIKVGFTIKRCPHCSADMHEMCASRATNCPACGKPLAGDQKRKKISFKVG